MTTREEALEAALRELVTRFDEYVAKHQPPGEDPAMFVRARAALAMPVEFGQCPVQVKVLRGVVENLLGLVPCDGAEVYVDSARAALAATEESK